MNKRAIGASYEEKAALYLKEIGYHILERNFRCKIGELDLIGKNEDYLCFIEVKFRSDSSKGYPSEAINHNKIRKITRTAQYYMMVNNIPQDTPCRFDTVFILDDEITVIKNAFDGI